MSEAEKLEPNDAAEIAAIIERARAAQAQIEDYSQEQIDALLRAMVWSCCQPGVAESIAQHTLDETQLGDYNGKFLKIHTKTRASLMDIINDKSVGVIEEDRERNIIKIAKPVGVIGALCPSTNPEATPVIKAINAVKGRNAIVIAPHPRAKLTNKMIVDNMRAALVKMGAPRRPRAGCGYRQPRTHGRAHEAVRPDSRNRRCRHGQSGLLQRHAGVGCRGRQRGGHR